MLKQAEHFKPVDPAAELIGKKLNFKAEDLDHNWYTSEELFSKNRFTLVNIWGTWCGPCKSELADLGEFHRQIGDKDCGVLGIEHEHKAYEKFVQDAKDILKEKNVTYPNVLINDDMDLNDKIPGHPTFFFVNSEGVVVSPIYMGTTPVFDTFTPVLDQLLAEADSVNSGFKSTDLDGNTVTSEELNGTAIPKTEDQETGSYRYRVFVKDEEGNSLEEVAVQFCDADACRVGETDEQGCAVFEVSEEKSYEIHILDVPDGFEDLEETFNTDVKASDTTIVLKKQ
jgi:thiol-disulfide isomerase/thioredoxin